MTVRKKRINKIQLRTMLRMLNSTTQIRITRTNKCMESNSMMTTSNNSLITTSRTTMCTCIEAAGGHQSDARLWSSGQIALRMGAQ